MKRIPYLDDFDLDGDVCECGQPIATHSPITPPKSIALGRVGGETKPFSRAWRSRPYEPPPPEPDLKPELNAEQLVYAAIRADPMHATYESVGRAVGRSSASVNQRIKRLARDGLLPPDIVEWCERRTRSRAKWDLGVW